MDSTSPENVKVKSVFCLVSFVRGKLETVSPDFRSKKKLEKMNDQNTRISSKNGRPWSQRKILL